MSLRRPALLSVLAGSLLLILLAFLVLWIFFALVARFDFIARDRLRSISVRSVYVFIV